MPLAAQRASTELTYTMRYTREQGAPRLVLSLTYRPPAGGIDTLRLPRFWANQQQLWRGIDSLRVVGAQLRLPTRGDSSVRVVRYSGRAPITVQWVVRQDFAQPIDRDTWYRAMVGAEWFCVSGYNALIVPEGPADAPIRVRWLWQRTADELLAGSFGEDSAPQPSSRVALRNALFVGGQAQLDVRQVGQTAVTIALLGAHPVHTSAYGDAVRDVMAAALTYWKDHGPSRYLVASLPAGQRGNFGGTRLTQAFLTYLGPQVTLDDPLTALLAHEVMHEWLGSRLVAEEIGASGSWLTEGFADFVAEQALWHSGRWSDSVYAARINATLQEHARSRRRGVRFDSVVTHFWTEAEAGREPYLRGHVLGLRMEALARQRTAPMSRDTVASRERSTFVGEALRALLDSSGATRVVTPAMLAAQLRAVPADSVRGWWQRLVWRGEAFDGGDDLLGPCFVHTRVPLEEYVLGFDLARSRVARRVVGVDSAGPAYAAGLRDDEPLRGISMTPGDLLRETQVVVGTSDMQRIIRYRPVRATGVLVSQYRPRPVSPTVERGDACNGS